MQIFSHSLDYAMLQKICFQELNYSSFAQTKKQAKKDSFDKFIVKVKILNNTMLWI